MRPLGSRSRAQLFQHLDALVGYHEKARLCIPRTAVLVCPLQHPEVPVPRRVCACLLVPRTAVSALPLQNIEVSLPRRTRARFLGPRVAVRTQPLQQLEMPVPRRTRITRSRTSATFARNHCSTSRCPPSATGPDKYVVSRRPLRCRCCSVLSSLRGARTIELIYLTFCRRHRVAHLTTHRPKPCEVNWI